VSAPLSMHSTSGSDESRRENLKRVLGDLLERRLVRVVDPLLEGDVHNGRGCVGGEGGGGVVESGRPGTEADFAPTGPRVDAENFVIGLAERGVRSSVVRLPPIVHSSLDHHGFAHVLIGIARQTGVSGYVEDGTNRWPSMHTLDAARAYRLALESAPPGSRLHAIADEGIPFRDIASVIGRGAGVPTASISASDAAGQFSFLGAFVGIDNPVSSEVTRKVLGWDPVEPGLLEDLEHGHYFG
jgi:nucleoside-diphosphate-sugar epimerase